MSSRTLEERLAALSPDARALLWLRLQRRAHELWSPDAASEQLVAYFESRGNTPVPPRDLRQLLADRLPSFLVPSRFVRLDALPLLPNGKVNRNALAERRDGTEGAPAPAPAAPAITQATGDDAARLLAIWREVLGAPGIGPDDDFFEAGGDSILAMRLIARAARTGLNVTLADFFRAPTASGMLAAARSRPSVHPSLSRGTASRSGRPVPLTPIQHWFFEQEFAGADRWNQVQMLEIPRGLDHEGLQTALTAVVHHHEALRLAFVRKAGGWQQHVKAVAGSIAVPWIQIDAADPSRREAALEREAATVQDAIRLDSGLLLRAVRVRFHGRRDDGGSPDQTDTLVVAAHHLAVDIVSWSIVLDDLESACRQLEAGGTVSLPPVVSFSDWAEALHTYAQGPELRQDLSWWSEASRTAVHPLPRDLTGRGANDEASADVVVTRLGHEDTERVLTGGAKAGGFDISEYLLAGLVQTLAAWSGLPTIIVGIEGHGRHDLVPTLDVSRTVGWFTSYYPVAFERTGSDRPANVLGLVRHRMRGVPRHGLSYGVLRYLTADDALTRELSAQPAPEVVFNYVGQERQSRAQDTRFRPGAVGFRVGRDPRARRASLLEINARVVHGSLELTCGYSRNVHRGETVERLMRDVLATVVALTHTQVEPDSGGSVAAPSDFPDAGLDQSELNALFDPT